MLLETKFKGIMVPDKHQSGDDKECKTYSNETSLRAGRHSRIVIATGAVCFARGEPLSLDLPIMLLGCCSGGSHCMQGRWRKDTDARQWPGLARDLKAVSKT